MSMHGASTEVRFCLFVLSVWSGIGAAGVGLMGRVDHDFLFPVLSW